MTNATLSIEDAHGATTIRIAGWFIVALSAGTALLTLIKPQHAAAIIGVLLVLAGAAEMLAGAWRQETRKLAMLAGGITVAAGLLFLTNPATSLLPAVTLIIGWLALRSVVLTLACFRQRGSVQLWTIISAATEFFLALVFAIGLSISTLAVSPSFLTLTVSLFGPIKPLIASFAWLLAISFVATGTLLLEVSSSARRETV